MVAEEETVWDGAEHQRRRLTSSDNSDSLDNGILAVDRLLLRDSVLVDCPHTVLGLPDSLLKLLDETRLGRLEASVIDRSCLQPLHEVSIRPFAIDVFPVMASEILDWLDRSEVAKKRISLSRRTFLSKLYDRLPSKRCPAIGLRLSEIEWFALEHDGRLPTHIEWICACRGTGDKTAMHGMDQEVIGAMNWIPPRGELPRDLLAGLKPVDAYSEGVSWAGCWDLLGNAAELTKRSAAEGEQSSFAIFPCTFYENYVSPGIFKSFDSGTVNENMSLTGFRLAYDKAV